MIKIEKTNVKGFEDAIRGMRNPMNSWERSDSCLCDPVEAMHCVKKYCSGNDYCIGKNDHDLMMKLAKAGSVHGKYRRMIVVYVDITAPLYWWKEFDTYKVGTVANSCSTMHKIHAKEFELDDFSHEHLKEYSADVFNVVVQALNAFRHLYLQEKDKTYWWQMIQLLPSSYNQKRTVMMNYEVLSNIYIYRKDHKLDEWRDFCRWIENLPYSEIITCNAEGKADDKS